MTDNLSWASGFMGVMIGILRKEFEPILRFPRQIDLSWFRQCKLPKMDRLF